MLQLLFAAVVVALSAVLIHGYGPGHGPSLIDYGAFCGGAGLLFAVFGVVACFVESLQGIFTLVPDALATFFILAGGIVSRPLECLRRPTDKLILGIRCNNESWQLH